MKYIDADKLIACLKKTMKSYESQMIDPTKYPIDHIDLMAFLAREYHAIIANVESLQQEQPEVDFEKEIARFALNGGTGDNTPTIGETARHFYELGLNAGKEDEK